MKQPPSKTKKNSIEKNSRFYQLVLTVNYLSELGDLDTELEWCLNGDWNFGLPDRTPLCTPGCEGFLHLPLPTPQTAPPPEEPLLLLGIDVRTVDNSIGDLRKMSIIHPSFLS